MAHAEVSIETWELVVSTLYMLAWKKQIVEGCSSWHGWWNRAMIGILRALEKDKEWLMGTKMGLVLKILCKFQMCQL